MKYCTKCGKELFDEAVICPGCGCKTESYNSSNELQSSALLNTLSQRTKTNAVIWIIIGALQILTGLFFIVGILNIVSAVNDLKYSADVLKNPIGIVERYEPLTMPIIVFGYNLIFGGVIGVIGSLYYLFAIRGFVMENKSQFESMAA